MVIINLKNKVKELIPKEISDLEYKVNDDEIHRVLLSLSVFGDNKKFDFYSLNIKKENWSLEHIFPQTPDKLPDKLESNDINLINKLLGNRLENQGKLKERFGRDINLHVLKSIKSKLKKSECNLNDEEKILVYKLMRTDKLNSIGNMALLLNNDNASNGNGMFDKKRINIVKRISSGSFVPKHTYDVFSKLLSDKMTPDISVWTETDITEHQLW
ncbi:MAG: DUF1524 domain-containing protein [Bacteroidales bacterium]|nr:DUF1524 domain-containing protein [Bacteroidales bacterium]